MPELNHGSYRGQGRLVSNGDTLPGVVTDATLTRRNGYQSHLSIKDKITGPDLQQLPSPHETVEAQQEQGGHRKLTDRDTVARHSQHQVLGQWWGTAGYLIASPDGEEPPGSDEFSFRKGLEVV